MVRRKTPLTLLHPKDTVESGDKYITNSSPFWLLSVMMTRRSSPRKAPPPGAPPPLTLPNETVEVHPTAPPARTSLRLTSQKEKGEPISRFQRQTAFANDPLRSPPLLVPNDDIPALSGPNFLTTNLIDYIIQRGFPSEHIKDDLLIGSSNSFSFFEMMNKKEVDSRDVSDVRTIGVLRRRYQKYSHGCFKFLAVNCSMSHFFVVSVCFDVESTNIFKEVYVYDSLRRSSRNQSVINTSIPGQMLRHLQLFLANFAFFNTPHKHRLQQEPDFILREAIFMSCPQQRNGYDCGLFGLAVLMHLVEGKEPNVQSFGQEDVDLFRSGLARELGGRQKLNWQFLSSFFPLLKTEKGTLEESIAVVGDTSVAIDVDDDNDSEGGDCIAVAIDDDENNDNDANDAVHDYDEDEDEDRGEPTQNEERKVDAHFVEMFVTNRQQFTQLDEVSSSINRYEKESGFHLIIKKSETFGRTYVCGTHVGCCFRARFGRVRLQEMIELKSSGGSITFPYHCGTLAPTIVHGRARKQRVKGKVEPNVDHVSAVKEADPVPRDVMKAAASLAGEQLSYNQSFRAIRTAFRDRWHQESASFEMISPYLQKFASLNPGTTIGYEGDLDFNLERFFVCPGIMKTTLRYVRPVMSLDACHLKSKWRGTMYVASVKTGCDRIYPVAMAIARENENEDGWTWFLELLHSAVEILVMEHPRATVFCKYFSFISDRQKGLINALRKVFPNNHSYYCAIHIARNAESVAGKRLAKYVYPLSKTFSHRLSADWLEKIGDMSIKGREYLEAIPDNQWRSTAWLDDTTLPPRFGIVTSNMSESMNNMFSKARDGSWLHSLDYMLGTMMERISTLRREVDGKTGVVAGVLSQVKTRWDKSAGFKVIEIMEGGDKFNVIRLSTKAGDNTQRYTIDVARKWCECGEWQEHNIPCIDAIAYYRFHEKLTADEVLANHVDKLYTYENEKEMLRMNIIPVCTDTITPNGLSKPPKPLTERGSGRPKKERFRRRSIPSETRGGVVCSRCSMKGHNVRTCLRREAKRAKQQTPQEMTEQSTEVFDQDGDTSTEVMDKDGETKMAEREEGGDPEWLQELDLS